MTQEIIFDVCVPSERAAGILGFSDTIIISVESGDPGGDPGEFSDHILMALKEWYDGGNVVLRVRP